MIRLVKSTAPAVLIKNELAWTKTLVDKVLAGVEPTAAEKARYRHSSIKAQLVIETNGKCAYCESKLLHIHHGDVEHIFPKSLDASQTFIWSNLTLSCEICNQNKSNRDPNLDYIINPYMVNPADHVVFRGSLLFAKGTASGESTLALLELNRADLVERRSEYLKGLMGLMQAIYRLDLPLVARRALFQDFVSTYTSPFASYSAMVSAIVQQVRMELPREVTEGL